MFEERAKQRSKTSWFLLQSVFVPLIAGFASAWLFVIFAAFIGLPAKPVLIAGPITRRSSMTGDILISTLTLMAAGFVLSYVVANRWRSAISTGIWIWVLPSVLFAQAFVGSWNHPFITRRSLLANYFQGLGGGGEGLHFAALTVPTFTTLGYSIGLMVCYIALQRNQARIRSESG
jgi:hypothetical protein